MTDASVNINNQLIWYQSWLSNCHNVISAYQLCTVSVITRSPCHTVGIQEDGFTIGATQQMPSLDVNRVDRDASLRLVKPCVILRPRPCRERGRNKQPVRARKKADRVQAWVWHIVVCGHTSRCEVQMITQFKPQSSNCGSAHHSIHSSSPAYAPKLS